MFLQRSYRVITSMQTRLFGVGRAHFATSSDDNDHAIPKVHVEVSADGSTIACWHPEPTIPYEHTMPLPRRSKEISEGDSVLKVQYLLEEKQKYRQDGPTDQELMKIFHTSRPEWRPKPRRRYANQNVPRDRKSI